MPDRKRHHSDTGGDLRPVPRAGDGSAVQPPRPQSAGRAVSADHRLFLCVQHALLHLRQRPAQCGESQLRHEGLCLLLRFEHRAELSADLRSRRLPRTGHPGRGYRHPAVPGQRGHYLRVLRTPQQKHPPGPGLPSAAGIGDDIPVFEVCLPGGAERDCLGPGQLPADRYPGLYRQFRGDAGGQRRHGQPEPAVPGGVLRPG